jgi:hypothetical protein
MADDPIVQMAADPDFPKLPVEEQRKALAAHDPDFGKLGDGDISSFVSSHQGIQTPDAMAQSAAQTQGVIKNVSQNMQPSMLGGAHPSQQQEQTISAARPQIPGMVSSIRQAALAPVGAEVGSALAGARMGVKLPWIARTMAGASGAGVGSGAGTLMSTGSPKEALGNAAGYAATAAPLTGLAEGVPALQSAASKIVRDPTTGKVRSPWEIAVDKMVPDPYAPTATPAQSVPKGTNYGQYLADRNSAYIDNQKFTAAAAKAAKTAKPPWETPVEKNPGAPLPAAGDFYENKGTDLLNRQKAQDLMDRQAARTAKANAPAPQKPDPFYGMTSSDKPIGNAPVPPPGTYPLTKMTPPTPEPTGVPSDEGVPGSLPNPSGRLVVLPQEAQALDQMQKIAKVRASQHGMQYAAGMRPAGGGRVPRSPTGISTTEYPGARQEVPEGNPTPFAPPALQTETDSLGIRWAVSPEGYRVSIPKGVPPEGVQAYALPKLAEQAKVHSSLPWMKSKA